MDVTLLRFLIEVLGFLAEIVVFFLSLVWIPILVAFVWVLLKLWDALSNLWERFGPEDKTIYAFGKDNLHEKIQNIALKHENETWLRIRFLRGGSWALDPEEVSRKVSIAQVLWLPYTPDTILRNTLKDNMPAITLWKIIKEVESCKRLYDYSYTYLMVYILNEEGKQVERYDIKYYSKR